MSDKKLSKEDIQHLAKLANLQVNDSEVESLSKQLAETISYVENLNELDTSKIKKSLPQGNQTNVGFRDGEKNNRQLPQEQALANSKHRKGKYFVVSRII